MDPVNAREELARLSKFRALMSNRFAIPPRWNRPVPKELQNSDAFVFDLGLKERWTQYIRSKQLGLDRKLAMMMTKKRYSELLDHRIGVVSVWIGHIQSGWQYDKDTR